MYELRNLSGIDGYSENTNGEEEKMKAFIDGDCLCITADDFVNLQESEAVFVKLSSLCAICDKKIHDMADLDARAQREKGIGMEYTACSCGCGGHD